MNFYVLIFNAVCTYRPKYQKYLEPTSMPIDSISPMLTSLEKTSGGQVRPLPVEPKVPVGVAWMRILKQIND